MKRKNSMLGGKCFFYYPIFLVVSIFCVSGSAIAIELIPGFQDTQPKYIIRDGKQSGICYDIFRGIESYVDPGEISFRYPTSYTPLKRIMYEMELGRIHVYCGAGFNKERAKQFVYSEHPLYPVENLIVGRANDPSEVNSLDDLVASKSEVLTLGGTSTERFLIKNNVLMVPINPNNVVHGLRLVLAERADHFVYHDIGLLYHIKEYFDINMFKFGATPVRQYAHWMIFSKKLPKDVISKINSALKEMAARGELKMIMSKYR